MDDEVESVWVAMFERWFDEKTAENRGSMDDAAAELRLRDLEPPYDRVKAKTDGMQAETKRLGPDAFSEELDEEIAEFLEARKKPKTRSRGAGVHSRRWRWMSLHRQAGTLAMNLDGKISLPNDFGRPHRETIGQVA